MPKKRIPLIDDDPDFTSLLKLNLEETGAYEVREENHSEQALALSRKSRSLDRWLKRSGVKINKYR